ncbi:NADH:flavin oxidoreductase [Halalkalicoccus salilacus]|uniref:NADH:flavin oxidoreductase n=1 Tax=Halalkalicoccus salilacus TaxID=3117459 RepID=UPI00300F704E
MSQIPVDDPLFEEFRLSGLELENRVGLSPMTRISATETGRATDQMAEYYARFARGGFSFLITEGIYTDEAHSQGYAGQPGLATDEQAASWEPVTDAVHEEDAPIIAQLMHAGPLVQGNRFVDRPIAPSEVPPKGEPLEAYGGSDEFATPRAMTDEDVEDVIEGFVDAARRAEDAGFNGVEIHGANGYLLDSFLTEYTNDRDDEYGGSPESRVRFPAEVVEAVREAVSEEFVVGIRISQSKVNDPDYRWSGEEEAETVFGALSAAGVDYLHVTEAAITSPAFDSESGPTLSELAARYGDVPVIANGGLTDPELARDVLETGDADLLTLATGALANPDWPQRVAEGRELDAFDPEETLQPDASINEFELPE